MLFVRGSHLPDLPHKLGGFNRSMQHHLKNDLFKDGVALLTFSGKVAMLQIRRGNARRISARTPWKRQVFLSPLGRNHALRAELLPDVGVIPLAVELGVGQHQPDPCLLEAVSTTAGKFAQSFHGSRRAICASRDC